jgi:hypothetical protein
MAYLRTLARVCDTSGCLRLATVEVVNRWNGSNGVFCPRHGKAEVARANAAEGKRDDA